LGGGRRCDGAGSGGVGLRDEGISDVLDTREVISEDGVLSTIKETILSGINWGALRVGGVSHVVALVVGPVHGLLDFVAGGSLVSPVRVQIASGVAITSHRWLGFANHTLGGVGDVALEGGHVHLVSSSDGVVDPEPRANALSVGACWEVRDIKSLEGTSNTVAGDRHDYEVLWVDSLDVRFVCDT